jgi:hypothetical protein
MKKFFAVVVLLALVFFTPIKVPAAMITLAWDKNPESEVKGYKVYYGTSTHNYGYTLDVGNVTSGTITGLMEGLMYYFSATAYNENNFESTYSNELVYFKSYYYVLEPTFSSSGMTASGNVLLYPEIGRITSNVVSVPTDAKTIYWSNSQINTTGANQIVFISMKANYVLSGTPGAKAPVSVYAVNQATGIWSGPERVVYVNDSYGNYSAYIQIREAGNYTVFVSTGHKTGNYEFQQVQIGVVQPAVVPLSNLYLQQLMAPQNTANRFSAVCQWPQAPAATGYRVRVALKREEIEKGEAGVLVSSQLLPSSQTTFRTDITSAMYAGMYVAVSVVINGSESEPWTTWYMPGDNTNTADNSTPPLCFNGGVDATDIANAYSGYVANTPVGTAGNFPATMLERIDIDNNGYAGRMLDYSFCRSQNGKKMQ